MEIAKMMARWVVVAVLFVVMLATGTARADDASAKALFDSGREDMARANYAAACPKFEQSRELVPALGTLLNLALCYKRSGKTASSWRVYREAAVVADKAKKLEHAELARAEAAELEKALHRVLILPGTSAAQRVLLDERVLHANELGVALPIDPGKHVIVVAAPRREAFRMTFISAAGIHEVKVPPLVRVAPPNDEASSLPPPGAAPERPTPADDAAGLGDLRYGAIALGVIGIAGVVVGGVFMGRRSARTSDAEPLCSERNICHSSGVTLREEAATAGTVAVVGFSVGGAALVAAAVLWLTGGSDVAETVSIGPLRRGPGVGVTARW